MNQFSCTCAEAQALSDSAAWERMRAGSFRPLLKFNREEILQYLEDHNIPFRIDSSNLQDKYTRNKVRLHLLPKMKDIFGTQVSGIISRSADIFSEQEVYLRLTVERLLSRHTTLTPGGKIVVDLAQFSRYDTILKRIAIALCYERLTGSLKEFDFAATERVLSLLAIRKGVVDLKQNVFAEATSKRLYLYGKGKTPRQQGIKLNGTINLKSYGIAIDCERLPVGSVDRKDLRKGDNFKVFLDQGKLDPPYCVRTPRESDRFSPLGLSGSKKLSDFFVDRKVDRPLREETPLLLAGGEIVWIIGHQIADQAKVTSATKRILKLEVKPYRSV